VFIGKRDPTHSGKLKCPRCSSSDKPVWRHGGVVCMLDAKPLKEFMWVSLGLLRRDDTQLAETTMKRTAGNVSSVVQ
jgi:hypothetical protein